MREFFEIIDNTKENLKWYFLRPIYVRAYDVRYRLLLAKTMLANVISNTLEEILREEE